MNLNLELQNLWRLQDGRFVVVSGMGTLVACEEADGLCYAVPFTPERIEMLGRAQRDLRLDETPQAYKLGFYRAFHSSRSRDGAHFREPEKQDSVSSYKDELNNRLFSMGWQAGVSKAREVFSQSGQPMLLSTLEQRRKPYRACEVFITVGPRSGSALRVN